MSLINQLRSERAQVNTAVQALAKIEVEGGQLTAEQLADFEKLSGQFESLTAQIERAEWAERMQAATAQPVNPGVTAPQEPATPKAPAVRGASFSHMVRSLVQAKGNQQLAAQIAEQNGYGADVSMALNTLTPEAGGVLVPENMSSEVIELLRPRSVVRRLGARSMPMNNGNITIPRLKGGAVVGYIGQDSDIPSSQQQFDDLTLTAKKLAALVPISNTLLGFSGVNPNVDQLVVSDISAGMASKEDVTFLRSAGSATLPKGLLGWSLAANRFDASSGADLQQIEVDLNKAILRLENADANMYAPGWAMAPRTYRFLEGLRNSNGAKVYPTLEGREPTLKGYPVGITSQIPINLGAGGNESEIYFTDFGDTFIAEQSGLVIAFSTEAAYHDGNTFVSAFQRDQTLVRVIAQHDFGPRHVESISVIQKVVWGA
ncbi:phage capsid protein [Lysobacter enzymogenes]|uniref:phage major capsid protein n=1 Tax=Lysobacter enzymogenes TaxID=69 RepID=UPI0019D1FE28|nr:phage major capsid protein [Lysobacter enzymogenes]MBN7138994.1 phage capsid protein [Lysobacter enzymogenes]